MNRQQQIQSELSALLSLPCPDFTSQEVHDKLVLFDTLYAEGHTKECGVGMVWGNKECGCGEGQRAKGGTVKKVILMVLGCACWLSACSKCDKPQHSTKPPFYLITCDGVRYISYDTDKPLLQAKWHVAEKVMLNGDIAFWDGKKYVVVCPAK